jgi:hypothetical protein
MNNGKHCIITLKKDEALISYFGVILTRSSLSRDGSTQFC